MSQKAIKRMSGAAQIIWWKMFLRSLTLDCKSEHSLRHGWDLFWNKSLNLISLNIISINKSH